MRGNFDGEMTAGARLFSTMTCWPQTSDSRLARIRAPTSDPPPGGNPTSNRTGRVG